MRIILAAATFIAILAIDQHQAWAYGDGPWCSAVVFDHSVVKSCHYRTFEECYPTILGGNRGFCEPNPDWYGRDLKAKQPSRHHKKRV